MCLTVSDVPVPATTQSTNQPMSKSEKNTRCLYDQYDKITLVQVFRYRTLECCQLESLRFGTLSGLLVHYHHDSTHTHTSSSSVRLRIFVPFRISTHINLRHCTQAGKVVAVATKTPLDPFSITFSSSHTLLDEPTRRNLHHDWSRTRESRWFDP